MSDLVVANRMADWRRLKALVLDSVSSPITKRVYNLGLDEFIEWYGQEPRPGFTKATVNAWCGVLEARGLGSVSINVRIRRCASRRPMFLKTRDGSGTCLANRVARSAARPIGTKSTRGFGNDHP